MFPLTPTLENEPAPHMHTHTLVFRRLTGDQALLQKMVYVLGNLLGIALGVYKCNSMGLLPTAQSDWLEFMAAKQVRVTAHVRGWGMTW